MVTWRADLDILGCSTDANRFRYLLFGPMRQFVKFTLVGIVNTVLFLMLFNVLRLSGVGPFVANGFAVILSIAFSFWANTRFTFKVDHGDRQARRLVEFATVFIATLAVSSAALLFLFRVIDQPSYLQESSVLAITGGAFSVVRFLVMRAWVFNPRRAV